MRGLFEYKLKVKGNISFVVGMAQAACFAALLLQPTPRHLFVIPFLGCFSLAFAAYVYAVWRLEHDHPHLAFIWSFAFLFRILLLFTNPTLSDDIYRFIWDGHLLNLGISPYAFAVNDSALDAYAIPIRELVNHNWMASPYLPAAQGLFWLIVRLAPQSAPAFQVTAASLDLLTGWLVMDMLGQLDLPRRRVLIYLWNPLVVTEFAHGAHVADALMILLATATFWILVRATPKNPKTGKLYLASTVSMAAATLTKGLPALLVPLFLRRWVWWRFGIYTMLVLASLAVFSAGEGWGLGIQADGTGLFGALRIYARQWNFNSGLYHWLEIGLTGYKTPGAVPAESPFESNIYLAKMVALSLLALSVLYCTAWVWRHDKPLVGDITKQTHNSRTLTLLRLAIIPIGAYLLLTPTVHPWYVIFIIPFLPFLSPGIDETPRLRRLLWPWLYFSWAVALSYYTYVIPNEFREYYWVRQVEYLPFFALLIWAARHAVVNGISYKE